MIELLHATLRPHLRQTRNAVELQQALLLLRPLLGAARPLWDLRQGARGRGLVGRVGAIGSGGRELGAAAQRADGSSLSLPHQTLVDHGLQTHSAQLGMDAHQDLLLLLLSVLLAAVAVGHQAGLSREPAGLQHLSGRLLYELPVSPDVPSAGELRRDREADDEFVSDGGGNQKYLPGFRQFSQQLLRRAVPCLWRTPHLFT